MSTIGQLVAVVIVSLCQHPIGRQCHCSIHGAGTHSSVDTCFFLPIRHAKTHDKKWCKQLCALSCDGFGPKVVVSARRSLPEWTNLHDSRWTGGNYFRKSHQHQQSDRQAFRQPATQLTTTSCYYWCPNLLWEDAAGRGSKTTTFALTICVYCPATRTNETINNMLLLIQTWRHYLQPPQQTVNTLIRCVFFCLKQ